MGYSLTIGEFEVGSYPEDRYASPGAAGASSEEAPINSSDRRDNSCDPSYTAWHDFAKEAGLFSVFYAPRCPCEVCTGKGLRECANAGKAHWWVGPDGEERVGLIESHPGAAALEPVHLQAFEEALASYKALSEPRPGMAAWLKGRDEERERDPEGKGWVMHPGEPVDYHLRRLEWLVWWTRWALENCKHPTFGNL